MILHPELYYFHNEKFDLERSIYVVAKAVSRWCKAYDASLIAPNKGVKIKCRSALLVGTMKDKETTIKEILDWIFKNSSLSDLFLLRMYKDPQNINSTDGPSTFDHSDDTCCWFLNLEYDQWMILRKELKKNNLPEDLFYFESEGKCIACEKSHKNILGFTLSKRINRFFTPKQWEEYSNKN